MPRPPRRPDPRPDRPPRRTPHEAARLRALPVDLRPEPGAPARPAHRPPRRRRGLGQARGRQLGPGVRRQQDPQAGVHRPRRARLRRGHAGLDRRLPVQPHPPGRRRRRQAGAEAAGWCRRAGWTGTTRSTTGSATSCCPDHGRRRTPRRQRLRHRHPRLLGGRAARGRGGRRHAVRHPGRRLGAPPRRPRVRQLGLRGRRAGARARRLLRHRHRLHRDRLDPRRHDRRLRRAGGDHRPAAPRDRHRRLGDAGEDPRPGGPDRPPHRRADRARSRPARRRDHGAGGLGRRPLRHPGGVHHRGHPAQRAARGHDHRPRLRGEVDGRPRRPRHAAARSPATRRCSTPTSAASRRSTPTAGSSARSRGSGAPVGASYELVVGATSSYDAPRPGRR